MRRSLLLATLALLLLAGGCTYESSGTTTTTLIDAAGLPPATGPASLTFEDQMVEGSAVVVASVTMPASGFVVLQADAAGAPGEVIGVSALIGRGTVSGVVVPFLFPLGASALIHATVYIDMDGDGAFRYESGDLVDVPATREDGAPATASATIGLLAPLAPAAVSLGDQRTDGVAVVVPEVSLPAPGFVALQDGSDGLPGTLLGMSTLLPEGTSRDLTIAFDRPLETSQAVFAVVYIDRDGNGVADLTGPDSPDAVAEGPDGGPARAAAEITVVLITPTELQVDDQEGDGTSVVVASVTLPSAGFLELLTDAAGSPGVVVVESDLLPRGTSTRVRLELEDPLTADATFWVRVRIDFDGDGSLGPDDPVGLTESGRRAQASLDYTFVEPD